MGVKSVFSNRPRSSDAKLRGANINFEELMQVVEEEEEMIMSDDSS
jgi:hypothetical protein